MRSLDRQRDPWLSRSPTGGPIGDGARQPRAAVRAGGAGGRRRGVGLDQLTKHTIATGIPVGQVKKFLPGDQVRPRAQHRRRVRLFSGGGALVLVFTCVALVALIGYFAAAPASGRWLWLPTGLLVGGAIGNLIDRIANGAVIDFIKLPLWPAFNVADMSITFGVIALALVLEGGRRAMSG